MTNTSTTPLEHLPVGEHAEGMDQPPPPPPPPDSSAEEKEAYWYKHVYRGDNIKQLTLRAVLMGGFLGMFMSISNLYTTLQLGWSFGVAITSCILSYVIWNALRAVTGNRLTQMSVLENNCMQSTASAAGYSTGSTIATAFGALLLMTGVHQPLWVVTSVTFLTAMLGVFLAIPLKRQMINVEQLRFPSGIAPAETLRSLYVPGGEAVRKAYALVIALACGAVVGLLRSYGVLVDQFRENKILPQWLDKLHANFYIIDQIALSTRALTGVRGAVSMIPKGKTDAVAVAGSNLLNFGFEPSVLLIAAGMITGLRVSLSMLAGSLLLYFVVGPYLIGIDQATPGSGWITGPEGTIFNGNLADPKIFNIPIVFDADNHLLIFHLMRWSLWGGSAIMVFSSLTSVALQWKTIARSFGSLKGSAGGAATAAIEVPVKWLIAGLIPISIGLIIVQVLAFHISVFLGVVAVALSFVVSLVCCRATGETDTTPIGAMGKITQLLYAVLPGAAGSAQINLMAAGVTANAGSSAADLLTDLKSGYLLGANPRKQFLAQFLGVFFGTAAIVPAWFLMVKDKAHLEKFNLPATTVWRAVAEVLAKGVDTIPHTALVAIVIGAFAGIALPVMGAIAPKASRYMPSAMGLGLSWVVGFHNALAFAIGAVIAAIWAKRWKKSGDTFIIPVASGLVAGESLMAALVAIAAALVGLWFTLKANGSAP